MYCITSKVFCKQGKSRVNRRSFENSSYPLQTWLHRKKKKTCKTGCFAHTGRGVAKRSKFRKIKKPEYPPSAASRVAVARGVRPTLTRASPALPSAKEPLTSMFEMGTGVTTPLCPPAKSRKLDTASHSVRQYTVLVFEIHVCQREHFPPHSNSGGHCHPSFFLLPSKRCLYFLIFGNAIIEGRSSLHGFFERYVIEFE